MEAIEYDVKSESPGREELAAEPFNKIHEIEREGKSEPADWKSSRKECGLAERHEKKARD